LEKTIDRVIETSPHSREILDAFRPVILERHRLMEIWNGNPSTQRSSTGKIEQRNSLDKTGGDVAARRPLERGRPCLDPGFQAGFYRPSGDLDALQDCIMSGDLDFYEYFRASSGDADRIPERLYEKANVRPAASRLFLRTLTWVVLHRRRRDMAFSIEEADWHQGTCPICGSFPSISVITEKNAQRWLHCFQCGQDWRFSRVICPCCSHEGRTGMTFFVEDKKQECVFICEQCNRYLLTLNQVRDIQEIDLDISALGLAHLDILMRDKGYVPMVPAEWNPS